MAKAFRDLLVWQKAMDLSVAIYRTTEVFPKAEVYGLTSQMRRAAVSVVSNIAEGAGRFSKKDFCHFCGDGERIQLRIADAYPSGIAVGPFGEQRCKASRSTGD